MNRPICGCEHTGVIETRRTDADSQSIKRRRKCTHCQFRWSTVEVMVGIPISVARLSVGRVVRGGV